MYLLIHEMGHTFGLADIYVRGNKGGIYDSTGGLDKTAGTQPASIMSGFFVESLEFSWITTDDWDKLQYITQDDANGIVWLYKYYHENQPLEDCYFPDYTFQEKPRGCVPIHPIIFELKHGNETVWQFEPVITQDPNLDINVRDSQDRTALDYTVIHEYKYALKKLLVAKKYRGKCGWQGWAHGTAFALHPGGYEFGGRKVTGS